VAPLCHVHLQHHTAHSYPAPGFTPFELTYGHQVILPTALTKQPKPTYSYDDYAQELRERIRATNQLAKDHLKQEKAKLQYDKSVNRRTFKVGGKVQLYDAGSDTLYANTTWWLQAAMPPTAPGVVLPRPVRVLSRQRHQDVLLVQLEGVHDRDQAQALKGATLHLPRSCFPQTADDEYYWVDLIGCSLYGKNNAEECVLLGHVTQVSDNGAHALLHVAAATDRTKHATEYLIPFVAAHILRVDLPERRIDSNWPVHF